MTEARTHAKARCRWCGGRFALIFDKHWICQTPACAEKQIAHAVLRRKPPADTSPYLFLPLPFQVDVELHPVRRLLVHGAAGVSKSYFGRWYAYKRCLKIPGFRVLLLRCTYDQLNKNHLQFMEDEAHLIGGDLCKWTPPGNSPNARTMQFFHKGDPTAKVMMGFCADLGDIAQHVGPEYDLVLLEEGVTLLVKAIREISARDRGSATAREFRAKCGLGLKGQTRILTNPGGIAMNYLREFYIDKNPDPAKYPKYNPIYYDNLQGEIADNPYLEEDFEDASLGHLDAERLAQLASGRWDVFEGQFFSKFNPAIHVRDIEAR